LTAPIVAVDTETVGLSLGPDVIWEFAGIRREPDGTMQTLHLFIAHDLDLAADMPAKFRADHDARFDLSACVSRESAAGQIFDFLGDRGTGRPHIVGAVPNFDTERLAFLIEDAAGLTPGWHYHLIDVEALVVGYLAGKGVVLRPDLPWDSDDLSWAIGVDAPAETRHQAMADARWALAIYDRVMSSE
jgi:hypothetical protein